MTNRLRNLYRIKITLSGVRPPIWRRLVVPSDIRLRDLHTVIQAVMGWTNSHLHQFVANGRYFGEPDPDFDESMMDEARFRVGELLNNGSRRIVYEYDFGDGWEHQVDLEQVLPYEADKAHPICLKGSRACPPEDCGGPYGYQRLLTILSDASHEEHAEMLEWVGDYFDPERFSVRDANAAIAAYLR